MSGVNIDSVADTAPGPDAYVFPAPAWRAAAGNRGPRPWMARPATIAAGDAGWVGGIRRGGGWGWLVGRGLDGEVLEVLVDERGPHVGDVGVLGDVVEHERLRWRVSDTATWTRKSSLPETTNRARVSGRLMMKSRKPSTAVRVLCWRRTAMRAWTWRLSGSRLTPA
jgi:hypothetical protein